MKKITITPEQAREWLKRHEDRQPESEERRALNRQRVELFADQMRDGEWLLTGDCIVFDPNGQILDGMHRIAAVAEAGVAVEQYVVEDYVAE